MSSLLQQRVKCASLASKIVKDAKELLPLFKNGDFIGMSGFTGKLAKKFQIEFDHQFTV